ncbi:unnamed protein product [Lactuca saligna]|uniref:Uncharacterized protein n=1 Tax=Lactuca saligna TaxID=75948 RepID=A0AA35YTA0_LACSI|nr:unnamed protein product [Lactuca saligna]
MKGRLDSTLHLASYLLNPYYHYNDSQLQYDPDVTDAVLEFFDTLFCVDLEKQRQVVTIDLPMYKKKVDRFGCNLAITHCKVNDPDFDPDEVDPKTGDEALATDVSQAPREIPRTKELLDDDFESESESEEQVLEEEEYESDGVQIMEVCGED